MLHKILRQTQFSSSFSFVYCHDFTVLKFKCLGGGGTIHTHHRTSVSTCGPYTCISHTVTVTSSRPWQILHNFEQNSSFQQKRGIEKWAKDLSMSLITTCSV